MTATQTVNGGKGAPDPDIVRRFHFTRDMVEGPVYRKYKFAINRLWNVDDLDFTQDAQDWKRIDDAQRDGLLGVTVRFLAGEQAVTDELVPMIAASHALGRFDWVTFLSTFLMEEAKHAEFFMRWHDEVVGVLEPEEVAAHFLVRDATVDPSGRFEVRDVLHEALPKYGRELLDGRDGRRHRPHERAFVRFSAAYNAFVEGVLTMPSYEIVIDTAALGRLPGAPQGFRLILLDEGRHITFGTGACKTLIEKRPRPGGRGPRRLRCVSRQRRRPGRVPEGGPGPRGSEVPGPEGPPLPQPLPRDGNHPRPDPDRSDPRPGDRLRRRAPGRLMTRRARPRTVRMDERGLVELDDSIPEDLAIEDGRASSTPRT